MKKTFLRIISTLLGISIVSADLTASQIQQVEKIHTVLAEYAQQLDGQFEDKEYMYQQAKTQREGLLLFIEQALACSGDMCMTYTYEQIKAELMNYFQSYLTMKKSYEILKTVDPNPNPQAQKGILYLQKHLMQLVSAGYDLNRPIREVGVANIDFSVMLPLVGAIAGDIVMDVDSKYDLSKGVMDSQQDIDGELMIDTPGQPNKKIQAKGTIHVKMIDDVLYLGLNGLQVEEDGEVSQEIAMINYVQAVLGDAYLQVPLAQDGTQFALSTLNGASMWSSIHQDMMTKPLFDFYHQENPFTYYGVPSKHLCDMLQALTNDQGAKQQCYQRIDDILVHSQGKGIIVLKQEEGGYNLSIDDKYAQESETMPSYLLRKPIVSRNSEKIKKIQVQLSEDSNDSIRFEDNDFVVKYDDQDGSAHMQANITEDHITGVGTIMMDDLVLTIGLDYQRNLLETMDMTIQASQAGEEVFSLTIDIQGEVQYIDSVDAQAPTNIVTVEQLQDMMLPSINTDAQPDMMIDEVELEITQ